MERVSGANKDMAFAKRTFLAVFIVIFVSAVFLLAIFPPSTPRIFLNHRRAVESIRQLNLAEHDYAAQHPDAGFTCNLSDLGSQGSESLPRVGLVDQLLASGTKNSYHFEILCSQYSGQKATRYTITALPVEAGMTGKYALCSSQSGEIWYSENGSVSDCLAMRKPVEQKYREQIG